jgi:hypothetical protein
LAQLDVTTAQAEATANQSGFAAMSEWKQSQWLALASYEDAEAADDEQLQTTLASAEASRGGGKAAADQTQTDAVAQAADTREVSRDAAQSQKTTADAAVTKQEQQSGAAAQKTDKAAQSDAKQTQTSRQSTAQQTQKHAQDQAAKSQVQAELPPAFAAAKAAVQAENTAQVQNSQAAVALAQQQAQAQAGAANGVVVPQQQQAQTAAQADQALLLVLANNQGGRGVNAAEQQLQSDQNQPASSFANVQPASIPSEGSKTWQWIKGALVGILVTVAILAIVLVPVAALAAGLSLASGLSFMTSMTIIGLPLLLGGATYAGIGRSNAGQSWWQAIGGGLTDVIGVSNIYTGITGKDLWTQKDLNLSPFEQGERFGAGVTELGMIIVPFTPRGKAAFGKANNWVDGRLAGWRGKPVGGVKPPGAATEPPVQVNGTPPEGAGPTTVGEPPTGTTAAPPEPVAPKPQVPESSPTSPEVPEPTPGGVAEPGSPVGEPGGPAAPSEPAGTPGGNKPNPVAEAAEPSAGGQPAESPGKPGKPAEPEPFSEICEGVDGGCFAAGTPLLIPGGSKAIEQFVPGDVLLSRDEYDIESAVSSKIVEEVVSHFAKLIELHVGSRVIGTTTEHPFWVRGKGWLPARALMAGDRLVGHDNQESVVGKVVDLDEWAVVYNLRVADFHTYFVGCPEWGFSVWAHNANCTILRSENGEFVLQRSDGTELFRGNSIRDVIDFVNQWNKDHPDNPLILRVRYHTDSTGLRDIMERESINYSPSDRVSGVHIEFEPFGDPATAAREFSLNNSGGRQVTFDLKPGDQVEPTPVTNLSERKTGVIRKAADEAGDQLGGDEIKWMPLGDRQPEYTTTKMLQNAEAMKLPWLTRTWNTVKSTLFGWWYK